MKIYILAAGSGNRLWPFDQIRNKACIPIGNRPLITHTVKACRDAGTSDIIITGGYLFETITNALLNEEGVQYFNVGNTSGPAATLSSVLKLCPPDGDFIVLNGDTLLFSDDIKALADNHKANPSDITLLVTPEKNDHDSNEHICCSASDTELIHIIGHPSHGSYRQIVGYACSPGFIKFIDHNGGFFKELSVGSMPPHESYLEQSVADYHHRGNTVPAITAQLPAIDIDKPWHILEANYAFGKFQTAMLTQNDLAEGAYIDPLAVIKGHVKLGKNSFIGRNCVIEGNLIVGDNTAIDNGAIIDGHAMIGDHVDIRNYCYISGGSTIGNLCKVLHGAEFSGTLFDRVYLYHYMEIEGLLGYNVDIGAACACGTLRFDERSAPVTVNGHRVIPRNYANSTYIGDYTRTGVNCSFMPGIRIGAYCAIGPAAYITEDVPDRTLLLVKQEHVMKPWGPEKYGW